MRRRALTASFTNHQVRRTPICNDRSLLLRPSRLTKGSREPVTGRATEQQQDRSALASRDARIHAGAQLPIPDSDIDTCPCSAGGE